MGQCCVRLIFHSYSLEFEQFFFYSIALQIYLQIEEVFQ